MLWLPLVVGTLRLLSPRAAERPDHGAFATFAALPIVLSAVSQLAR
jgi:hypothetical protein